MRVFAHPAFSNRDHNPYNALLYEHVLPHVDEVIEFRPRILVKGPIDIVHLHWPDLVVRNGSFRTAASSAVKYLIRLAVCKARGAKIVWTVHNLAPHDVRHAALERFYFARFLNLLDGAIFLTETARAEALEFYPALRKVPCEVIPHGHYKPVLTRGLSRGEARAELDLAAGAFVFLYFGQIREYKNVPLLVREFRALEAAGPEAVLVVAGLPGSPELRKEIEELAAGDARIRLDLRLIPDGTLETYLAACNCVVAPYRRILNSGSALMALSAARPVIAPAVGSLVEIAEQVGGRWLRCYQGEFGRALLAEAMEEAPPVAEEPDLEAYGWPAIGERTAGFYRSLG